MNVIRRWITQPNALLRAAALFGAGMALTLAAACLSWPLLPEGLLKNANPLWNWAVSSRPLVGGLQIFGFNLIFACVLVGANLSPPAVPALWADGGHLVLPNGRRSAPFRGPAATHAPYQRGLRHGGDVRLLLHRLGNGGHLFRPDPGGPDHRRTAAGYPPVPSGQAGPCFGIPAPVRRRHDRGGQHPPPDLNTGPGIKNDSGPLPFTLWTDFGYK